MTNSINEYIAAQLSDAAYDNPTTALECVKGVPDGWFDITNSVNSLLVKPLPFYDKTIGTFDNEFRIFANDISHQIAIVFKGSSINFSNWASDINPVDQGYSQYQQIEVAAQAYFDALSSDKVYGYYSFYTDGHSLGGGMAQSFSVKNQISGFGQNSLPISAKFIASYVSAKNPGASFASDIDLFRTNSHINSRFFDEVNVSGDIATNFYSSLNNLAGAQYINLNPRTLNAPYAALEIAELALGSVTGLGTIGLAAAVATGGYAHSIGVVLSLLRQQEVSGSLAQTGLSIGQSTALTDVLKSVSDSLTNLDSSLRVTIGTNTNSVFEANPTDGNSLVAGSEAHPILVGGLRNESLFARSADAVLLGGFGDDTLNAGSGNSTLIGGLGNDTLIGGGGTDSFDYIIPQGSLTTTETIKDDSGLGTVSIIDANAATIVQIKGGKSDQNKNFTWVDDSGTTYVYAANILGDIKGIGTLSINQGSLGPATGNQIIIKNFDLNKAETSKDGFLGIKLTEGSSVVPNSGNNQFALGDYASHDATITAKGAVQSLTIYASATSNTPQTVILALTNGDPSMYSCNIGMGTLDFSSGFVTLEIPPGSDSLTVGLVYTGDRTQSQTVSLTSTLQNLDGTGLQSLVSNTFTVNFDNSLVPPNQNFDRVTPISGVFTSSVIDGINTTYTNYVEGTNGSTNVNADNSVTTDDGSNNIVLGNGNNKIIAGSGNDTIVAGIGNNSINENGGQDLISISGNGNNVISAGGGQDLIYVGNGDNRIYGGVETDLITSLAQSKLENASGSRGSVIAVGSGNNTVIGGVGNDLILLGNGNDLVVMGPGNTTLEGGVFGSGFAKDWTADTTTTPTNGVTNIRYNSGHIVSTGGYQADAAYEGNLDDFSAPVGAGNETIFGGSGNDVIGTSNGDNYIDVGSGNSSVFAGAGSDTIFAGTGNVYINGAGGNDYIDAESGNDTIFGGSGNNTIIGGSGKSTLYANDGGSVYATENEGNNYVEGGSGDTIIYGSGGNDTLIAGSGNDTIYAGNGNTTIEGGNGSDAIVGGEGTNLIYAGDGGTASSPTQV